MATHEIGHGPGLADLHKAAYLEKTMYGYSQEREINKTDLNDGDIAGIQGPYGSN